MGCQYGRKSKMEKEDMTIEDLSGAAARTGKVYKKRKIKRYKKEINIHD